MKNKRISEVKWNIINSLLAGSLVLIGSLSSGELTLDGVCFALLAGATVALTKFKDYWAGSNSKKGTGRIALFSFIGA